MSPVAVAPRILPYLLTHGIAQGGYTGAVDPTTTQVTLDSTGATLLVAVYVADATHGGLDPFTDSAGNTWSTYGPTFNFGTHTAALFWVGSPITSATHTFTARCDPVGSSGGAAGHGHACLAVQAWGGMTSVLIGSLTQGDSATSPFTLGPFTATGWVLLFGTNGMGIDGTINNVITETDPGWTMVDSLPMQGRIPGICGLSVGYQLCATATPVTTTWTFGASSGAGGVGTAMIPFAFSAPPAPTTTTYQIRRLRRVALPWDEAHRWKRLDRLELVAQAGIGDSVTTDPVVMLRLSRDGGLTWGTEHHLHAGAVGDYLKRLSIRRLGRARYPVVELTTTDPVAWQWVELLVDLEEGTS